MTMRNGRWLIAGVIGSVCALGCGDDPPRPTGTSTAEAGAGGACEPRACADIEAACGEVDDGCGHPLLCSDACAGAGGQGGAGAPGAGGSCTEVVETTARNGRRARSAGFQASDELYLELFDVVCGDATTCVEECAKRDGTPEMCDMAECLPAPGDGNACVPAPIWGNLESIQVEDESVLDMSQIVLVKSSYHDTLLVDDFALDVPEGARVRGIVVEVRRAGDASVVDDSVRLVVGGKLVGAERGLPDGWKAEPGWVSYGGEDDIWGSDFSAADVIAEDFGVGLSAEYTKDAGNTRAYVDQVRVTVHYSVCE